MEMDVMGSRMTTAIYSLSGSLTLGSSAPQAIAAGILGLIALFYLRETYAPQVLKTKVRKAKSSRLGDDVYSVLVLESCPNGFGFGFLLSQFVRPGGPTLID